MIYIHIPVYFQQEGWKIVRCCQNWLLWNWDVFGGFRECKLAKIHFKSPPLYHYADYAQKELIIMVRPWTWLMWPSKANTSQSSLLTTRPSTSGFCAMLFIFHFKNLIFQGLCLLMPWTPDPWIAKARIFNCFYVDVWDFNKKKSHNCLNDTDGGKQPKMRPGWYRSGGLKFKQHMVYQVFTHH